MVSRPSTLPPCRLILTVGLMFSLASTSGAQAPAVADAFFPQGVAAGDVTDTSVVLWTRTAQPAALRLDVAPRPSLVGARTMELRTVLATDSTVQTSLDGLDPATLYHYRFRRVDGDDEVRGTFRTAPRPADDTLVSFVVAGDVGGQAICRHPETGYAAFGPMADLGTDFFIANGDMIYADDPCPAVGPEGRPNIPGDFVPVTKVDWTVPGKARQAILGHWRYNRADPHQQRLLASTPIYAQWDDHEVINDFGAPWPSWPADAARPGYPALVRDAKAALFDFNPIRRHAGEPDRIYRSFRWGKHLELFLLDARSYRSPNDQVDGPNKTLLGKEQLDWLKQGLKSSDATWKIVSSNVPLSFPTGWEAELWGRDGFASGERADFSRRTGAEHELLDWLTFLDRENIHNVVVVVTDVHFAANLRYDLDLDGDGDRLLLHELVNGPLNAWAAPVAAQTDETLKPIILYAEGGIFNFSHVRLERREHADGESVHLVAVIRDETGAVRFGSRLELAPQP